MTRWARGALATSIVLLASCGSDAHVVVQLRALADEDPYAGLTTLVVTLAGDGERVGRKRTRFDGRAIELPDAGDVQRVAVSIEGLAADDSVLSRGQGGASVREGQGCCLFVCFCTAARFEAAACGCGDDRCATSCAAEP